MENLFVYGTLQQPEVQMKVFGRVTDFRDDVLHGYKKGAVELKGIVYPMAIPEVGADIAGKVFTASPAEIAMMDEYETAAYQRVSVVLKSGRTAWVYREPSLPS